MRAIGLAIQMAFFLRGRMTVMKLFLWVFSGIVAASAGALFGVFATVLAIVPDESPEVVDRTLRENIPSGIAVAVFAWGLLSMLIYLKRRRVA
jgi:hypothetical protein